MGLYTEERKIQKQSKDGTYSMTIPKNFAEELNLNYGDTVLVTIEPNENRFIVTPKEK